MEGLVYIVKDRLVRNVKKYSPEILAGVSIVGVVATTVTAIKATPKAIDVLNELEEKHENVTKFDKFKSVFPYYIPTIFISGVTISSIAGSAFLGNRRYNRCKDICIGAYAILNDQFKEYKNKVELLYGEEANEKINNEIMKDHYNVQKGVIDIKDLDDQLHLFYDPISGRYFERKMFEMTNAAWELNRKYAIDGEVNLNYYYELLRLEPTKKGYCNGWCSAMSWELYGYAWIDILYDATVLDDGLVCYCLRYVIEPTENYMFY